MTVWMAPRKILFELSIRIRIIKLVSFLILVAYFCVAIFGVSAFGGWQDKISLKEYQLSRISKEAVSSQKIMCDDFGGVIKESEIREYTEPDIFWPSVCGSLGGMMIGSTLGMLYGYLTYDRNDSVGYMSFFVDAMVGGMIGFFGGLALTSSYPPQEMTRSDAISLIKKKRIENHNKQ